MDLGSCFTHMSSEDCFCLFTSLLFQKRRMKALRDTIKKLQLQMHITNKRAAEDNVTISTCDLHEKSHVTNLHAYGASTWLRSNPMWTKMLPLLSAWHSFHTAPTQSISQSTPIAVASLTAEFRNVPWHERGPWLSEAMAFPILKLPLAPITPLPWACTLLDTWGATKLTLGSLWSTAVHFAKLGFRADDFLFGDFHQPTCVRQGTGKTAQQGRPYGSNQW